MRRFRSEQLSEEIARSTSPKTSPQFDAKIAPEYVGDAESAAGLLFGTTGVASVDEGHGILRRMDIDRAFEDAIRDRAAGMPAS